MGLVQREVQKVYMWKEPYTVDTRQGPCPDGFHIPTNDEWQSVWNIVGAFVGGGGGSLGGYLYMPYAGYRDGGTSNVYNQGTNGAYWSCVSSSSATGYRMYFLSSAVYPKQAYYNTYGCSIRPFKDEVINPIDSGSTLKSGWVWTYHSGSNNYGIAYNNSEGLISLSSDGVDWYTLSDKNLGATTVYDYTNPQASSYGNFYQWGNNYGFPNSGSVTTSSAKVDASAYGGGNYYSSSTFILASSAGWDSSNNNDLRGGVTGVISGGGDILIRPTERKREPGPNTKAYYPLVSDINDYSGNSNNLTASSTLAFGTYGNVTAYTAGPNPFLYSTSAKLPTGNVTETISLWAYCTTLPSSYANYLIYHGNDTSGGYAALYVNRNKIPGGLCGVSLVGTQAISVNTWYLYTMTIQNNTVSIYLNGALINSGTSSTINIGATSSTYQFRIGRERSSGNSYNWRGGISEVIIEDKAWSADDIQKYFNSNKEKYGIS